MELETNVAGQKFIVTIDLSNGKAWVYIKIDQIWVSYYEQSTLVGCFPFINETTY